METTIKVFSGLCAVALFGACGGLEPPPPSGGSDAGVVSDPVGEVDEADGGPPVVARTPAPSPAPAPELERVLDVAELVARAMLQPGSVDAWVERNPQAFDAQFWACFDTLELTYLGNLPPPPTGPWEDQTPSGTTGALQMLAALRQMIENGDPWRSTQVGLAYDISLITTQPPGTADYDTFDRDAAAEILQGGTYLADPYACECLDLICGYVFTGASFRKDDL